MDSAMTNTKVLDNNPFSEAAGATKERPQWNPYDYHAGTVVGNI